ncbi:MAG: MurR/RpiR family transcriptional regulator [Proteobacteria bacterium]|nr:MurR/RpiR family transcriptional regulator [Pseudomonadota bacterium]
MDDVAAIAKRVERKFPRLSPRLRKAARYVVDHPQEVALESMRSIAARAAVHPSSMVRLARELGFDGYEAFRSPFRLWLASRPMAFAQRAELLRGHRRHKAITTLVRELLGKELDNLQHSILGIGVSRLIKAQRLLAGARQVFVLGLRSLYPPAFYFHYQCRMFMKNTTLLDGQAGTFADDLRHVSAGDVLLVFSYRPYSRDAKRAVDFAAGRGARIIAVTDSTVSPIAVDAVVALVVSNETTSFFPSVLPAMAVAQTLVALLVANGKAETERLLSLSAQQLESFDVYVVDR